MYTLRYNLLRGLWYDHAQPPVFNLFLGIVLKTAGSNALLAFVALLKLFSLTNSLLLYAILKRISTHKYLPLVLSLIYLLSPATLLFENELFYTSFISLMLLLSTYFLQKLPRK